MSELFSYSVDTVNAALIWNTTISGTYNDEKRESLVDQPTLRLAITSFLKEDEIQNVHATLQASDGIVRMPDWRLAWYGVYDGSLEWPSDYRNVVDGSAVCVLVGCEIFETTISSSTDTTVTLADDFAGQHIVVCPIWDMKLVTDVTFLTQSALSSTVQFTLIYENYPVFSVGSVTTLSNFPVMLKRNTVQGHRSGFISNLNQDNAGANVVSLTRDRVRDQAIGAVSFEVDSVEAYIDREREICSFEGRSSPFWLPTWQKDYKLSSDIQFGDFQINFDPKSYSVADRLEAICISTADETRVYLVDTVTSNENGITLTLLTPSLQEVSATDQRTTISRANLVRLDTDEFTTRVAGSIYSAALATIEVIR